MPKGIYKNPEERINKIRLYRIGRKLSEETKRRIGMSKKGKPFSELHKQALRKRHTPIKDTTKMVEARKKEWKSGIRSNKYRTGKKSANWRGGVTPLNQSIRTSLEYKLWRKSVFERDNYTCIWCGEKGYLEADHIKPFALYPELRFAIDNGRTLCKPCHRKTDTYASKTRWIYKNKLD